MSLAGLKKLVSCSCVLAVTLAAQCPPPGGYGGGGGGGPAAAPAIPPSPFLRPASPTTPSPAGPSTPQPAGPISPRAGGPAAPSAPPVTPSPGPSAPVPGVRPGPRTGGIALNFERGHTSKERLKLDWLHPVPPETKDSGTVASGPLSLQDALKVLWEDDERPLLVLRECNLCKDGDEALLSRSLSNDRTLLLTKWFRIVRLPAHVTERTHTFFNAFEAYGFEGGWPHFFLLATPDSKPVVFTGQQTQSQLWKGMQAVLEERYTADASKAVKKWLSVLDTFDTLDARRTELRERLSEVRADEGPESDKAKKLVAELASVEEERTKTLEREKKVRELGLRPMPKPLASAGK